MEHTFVIASIDSAGREVTMHTKRDVLDIAFVRPVNFTGSFTSGVLQPEGEVMKLALPNLSGTQTEQQAGEPAFGTHIKEAISVLKDWQRNP